MKPLYLRLAVFCAAILAAVQPPARAQQTNANKVAEDKLREAYISFVAGESAANTGQKQMALEQFREALSLYVDINNTFPGWSSNVVNYRITECLNQIKALEQGTPLKPDTGTAAPAAGPAPGAPPASTTTAQLPDYAKLKEERDSLTVVNRHLSWQIDDLKARLAKNEKKSLFPFMRKKSDHVSYSHIEAAVRAEAQRLIGKSDLDAAMNLLNEAALLFPKAEDMRLMLGVVCCQAGQFIRATEVLNALAQDSPTNAEARVVLGSAYMAMNDLNSAKAQMEEAARLNPKMPEASYNMAQILFRDPNSDPAAARHYYYQSVQLGGAPDLELENAIRRACLLRKASELGKKHLVPAPRR